MTLLRVMKEINNQILKNKWNIGNYCQSLSLILKLDYNILIDIMYCKPIKYIASIVVLLVFLGIGGNAFSQNRTALEKEKAKIENEIKKLNKDLSSVRADKKLNTKQLNALNKKIKEREKLIKNINSQLGIINQEITETQDSIRTLRGQIDSMKAEYAKIIRALYRERIYLSRLNMVYDSRDYNHRYLHRKYFREYSNYRKYQADLIAQKQNKLQDVSKNLEQRKNEQAGFLAQEVANKKQLNTEKKQKEQSIKSNDKKAQELQAQLKKKEQQARQLQQQIQRMINEEIRKAQEAKKKQQAANTNKTGKTGGTTTTTNTSSNTLSLTPQEVALSKDFQSNKGRLPWPVEKASVVREYGRYTHPSGGQMMNNGLQIQTSDGSAVRSVFQGEVTNVISFGKHQVVMLRHGDYITVYTDLDNVTVKKGSKVATKQKLGTVGKNDEGKSEFNFQIWKVSECQNPRNWLAK